MPKMRSYRDLEVWQQAMRLTRMVYALAPKLPKQEMYVLSDQMRRAALSIPANIAEGQGRRTDGAFALHILTSLWARLLNWRPCFNWLRIWAFFPPKRFNQFSPIWSNALRPLSKTEVIGRTAHGALRFPLEDFP